jgi:DUF917 family protein
MGRCLIASLAADDDDFGLNPDFREKRHLVVPFQNEYLAAALVEPDKNDSKEDIICTVPDLISILGQDGEGLGSPDLRYGLKVRVIAVPAHPLWTSTEEGLRAGGPEFFQLGSQWKSIGDYRLPKSVIVEFGREE